MVYKLVERSKGVVFASVVLILFGAFSAVLQIISLLLIIGQDASFGAQVWPGETLALPLFWVSSVMNIVIFLSWIVCGMGVLHLREKARMALRIVMSFYFINAVANIYLNIYLAQELDIAVPAAVLVAGVGFVLAFYLGMNHFFTHPRVIRQFRYASRAY
ncbi:MAG: hypothetical protein ACM3L6_05385 [Deltaproteobacteria bacterium]